MDERIQIYQDAIIKLGQKYKQLVLDRIDVGEMSKGEYTILIRKCEEEIAEMKEKIEELRLLNLQANQQPMPVCVFVISGSTQRVINTLNNELYEMLTDPHHGLLPADWYPFSKQAVNIHGFLNAILAKGYHFEIEYIEGFIDHAMLQRITNQAISNIVIVDLMSMDADNFETARYLDGRTNNTLFTPVDTYLANDLKTFLFTLRSRIFRLLETDLNAVPTFMFDIATHSNLEREIINHLNRRKSNPIQLSNRSTHLPIGINPSF